jgi:chitin synthase
MPDSITLLCNTILNDRNIMGLCGETRIANKTTSWVTQIQVYEYFIAHHLGKTFESVFGGVTCLPGCFSMYRLKAPGENEGEWIPILCSPDVVEEYSQNDVVTLHEKNLLLLGEDRFLSTLMLRTFPQRKMMFVPKAKCKTTVPDEFKVLLSQRRRWINSTVHNLLELVLVRSLCGTFCFSMQFVVLMDIIGTITLPVGIFLFYYLIYQLFVQKYDGLPSYIPLILVLLLLLLPPLLILFATRKAVYCLWMVLYLLALPVWNFILPVYAYWNFDDFAWGDTRKVQGETAGGAHGEVDGDFDERSVILRRWEEYESAFRRSAAKRISIERTANNPPDKNNVDHHAPYEYPAGRHPVYENVYGGQPYEQPHRYNNHSSESQHHLHLPHQGPPVSFRQVPHKGHYEKR